MKYARNDAKPYARQLMRGIRAAVPTPLAASGALDEAGLRSNIRHCLDDRGIDGLFVAGKQGEFLPMSAEERKRTFEIAVEASAGQGGGDDHVVC